MKRRSLAMAWRMDAHARQPQRSPFSILNKGLAAAGQKTKGYPATQGLLFCEVSIFGVCGFSGADKVVMNEVGRVRILRFAALV